MIKNYFLVLLAIVSTGINAQVISTLPVFPKESDTVTIIYDASLGNGALKGISPIYAHAGVITNLSTSGSDWKHVVGNWGTADNRVKMTSLGNNKWMLKYHMKSFYSQAGSFAAGEVIKQMAFVFRNADGSIVGRSNTGGDIYTEVYSASSQLLTKITVPESKSIIAETSDVVKMEAWASKDCKLTVTLDGTTYRQVNQTDSINAEFSGISSGNHLAVVSADDGNNIVYDTLRLVINPNVVKQTLPSGMEQGINYINDSTVLLALYAPFKNYVYVIGDFNDWQADANYFMNYDANQFIYWIEITGLAPNTEIGYQYWVDGKIRVADPFSPIMLHDWDDAYIPKSTYPNLKPYPKSKTSGWVTVMKPGAEDYNWQTTDFKRPLKSQLLVYELLIRDFTKAQTYKSVLDTLPYLKRLGINAIELMPITEFEGNISWGYNPASHMAIDKYYGSPEDFKALVDACHANGIAVILDVVYNHAFSTAPICQLYWNSKDFKPSTLSPYAYTDAYHPFNVGYDLNHSTNQTQYYVKKTLKYLLEEYRVDGFRFDLSKGITNKNSGSDVGAWGQYDQWRIDRLTDYHNHIQSISEGAYTILEHFADNSEEKVLGDKGMMLWGNAVHDASEAAMGWINTSDFGWSVDYIKRGMTANSVISYASSHDEERMAYKCKNYGNSSGSYNVKSESTYLKRNALTYALVTLTPGPKMTWQFDELGYDYSINYCGNGTVNDACRTDPKPVKWDYWTGISDRPDLYYQHAMFNHLKTNYTSVYAPSAHYLTSNGSFKRLQLDGQDFTTIVVGNFDVVNSNKAVGFTKTGWWYNYLTGDSLDVTNTSMSMDFAAGEYAIYTSKHIENPFLANPNASINKVETNDNIAIFPNPSVGIISLKSTNGELINAHFEIYQFSGQKVLSGSIGASSNIALDELSNGVYFIKIFTANSIKTASFVLTKP